MGRVREMTEKTAKRLPTPEDKPQDHAVGGVPGLWLRVSPNGRRVFRLSLRFRGKRITVTLGDLSKSFTPAEAIEQALEARAQARNGRDPRQKQREQEHRADSFASIA